MLADARAPDRDHANLLARRVAQLCAQALSIGEGGRVEARDVAGEVIVLLGPVPDCREIGPEVRGDDVARVSDEDRPVADAREAGDVLDHLCVVVGRQVALMLAPVGHRQPADEVGQPDVGGALLLGIFMQVVVELPGLVPDPEVVLLLRGEVVEDHEVREQDLVHPPPGLEAVEVVLGRLALDVPRLVREVGARRVDALALALEHLRDGMLGKPVDLEVGDELPQLLRNCDVALSVAEPDRRGDVERAFAARLAARPAGGRRRRLDEVAEEQVDLDGITRVRPVTRSLEEDERSARLLSERDPSSRPGNGVLRPLDDEHGTPHAGAKLARLLFLHVDRQSRRDERFGGRLEAPAHAVLDLLRRVRLEKEPGEEELEEASVVLQPVVPVVLGPALVGIEHVLERVADALG
jgi:hypothetical protein